MTYSIRLLSVWRFFLTAITPIALFIAFDKPSGVASPSFFVGVFIFAISFLWLPRITATAIAEVTIGCDKLSINWEKQFLFQNVPGNLVSWDDIRDYKYQPSTGMEVFKLTLRNGEKIIWQKHSGIVGDDDFPAFFTAFQEKVQEINSSAEPSRQIEKAKTIYETRLGLVFAVIYALALLVIPVVLILFPPKSSINYAPLVVGYVALIYFIAKVIKHRKANPKTGYS